MQRAVRRSLLERKATTAPDTASLRLGVMPWLQATDWPRLRDAAQLVERLGFDHLWAPDHLYAVFGDPHQPVFEGWTVLSAWAASTERVRLGLLVGANTFRNPGLIGKMAVTLDHVSAGRAILGLGGAWFALEHAAHGIDFGGGPGERLDRLDEAVTAIRALLDGREVTLHGRAYRFDRLRHAPRPLQPRLPLMIGGSGERKTLPIVARHADMWNAMGSAEELRRKDEVLRRHCQQVGRDDAQIERTVACKLLIRRDPTVAQDAWRNILAANGTVPEDVEHSWVGTPEQIAERLSAYLAIGFRTLIVELPAPYDEETMERLVGEVRPLVVGRVAREMESRSGAAP